MDPGAAFFSRSSLARLGGDIIISPRFTKKHKRQTAFHFLFPHSPPTTSETWLALRKKNKTVEEATLFSVLGERRRWWRQSFHLFFFFCFRIWASSYSFSFLLLYSRRSEHARSYTEPSFSWRHFRPPTRNTKWRGGEQQGRGEGRAGHGMAWHGIVLCAGCSRELAVLCLWLIGSFCAFFLLLPWAFMEIPYTTPFFHFFTLLGFS